MTSRAITAWGLVVWLGVVAACGGASEFETSTDAFSLQRSTRGDTVTIEAVGQPATALLPHPIAVESLDVSGVRGPQLGLVTRILPEPGGGLLVFDSRAVDGGSALFRYDSTGAFVGRIGRQGSGPGEYSGPVVGVAVNRSGLIAVRVNALHKVSVYSAEGDALADIGLERLGATTQDVTLLNDSSVLVSEEFGRGPCCPTKGVVRFDLSGQVLDSISPRDLWYAPPTEVVPFQPFSRWAVGPSGEIVSIRSDRVGALMTAPWRHPALLWTQWSVAAPQFLDDERQAHRRALEWLAKYAPGDLPGGVPFIPKQKQALKDFQIDLSGRVWLQRTTTAYQTGPLYVPPPPGLAPRVNFEERSVWVGFDSAGVLLGQVEFPVGTVQVRFVGPFAWTTRRDSAAGEVGVIKYRIARD
jgi:hypothetical protein